MFTASRVNSWEVFFIILKNKCQKVFLIRYVYVSLHHNNNLKQTKWK